MTCSALNTQAAAPVELNQEQSAALRAIKAFVLDDRQDAFILRGSAGTGKTTLIAQLVDELSAMRVTCAILAPTGRASRILQNKIGQMAKPVRTTARPSTASFTISSVWKSTRPPNQPMTPAYAYFFP